MRLMKNTRTGKIAVYDADLVETGRWEEFRKTDDEQPVQVPKQSGPDDAVAVQDEISITLVKGNEDEGQ